MKKFMAFVLTLAVAMSVLAGCGGNGNNSSKAESSKAESSVEESSAAESSAAESSAEESSAAEGGVIVIGCTGPLTGDASSYGISVQSGAQLAVDEINANGGLNGITFDFQMKDDKATAADAATGYDQLMDAGMKISIGSVTSGSCESFASKAVEDNLFFITPSASAATIIAERSNGYRICFSDPDQGTGAAQKLVNEYKAEKIGCIYDTSDTYSTGIYEAFEAEMKNLGKTFEVKTFDAENKKDFSTQAEALKDCDYVFVPFYYTEAGLVARAFAAKGSNAVIFGCDGLDGVADQIDETVKNSVSYITPFDVDSADEKVAKFVADFKAKFNATPDQFAADAYDAVYVIYEAMKAADVKDATISASDLCNAVTAVLQNNYSYAGVTGTMSWDATGAPVKDMIVKKVQ